MGVDVAKVTYLGPEDEFGFFYHGTHYVFKRGESVEVADAGALAQVQALNPRGVGLELARQYGAQLFEVGSSGAKASGKGGEG